MDDFSARVLDLFQTVHPLDRIPRAGYLLRGIPVPESVSAHSHFLSLLALLFLEQYPERGYDRDRVLGMAIVHDLSESKLMDIPMPYADAYLAEAKDKAEQAIFDDMFAGLGGRFSEWHREFAEAKTPEGRLVRALDKLQMMIKCAFYERENQGRMAEFWANPKNFADYGVAEVSDFFEALCEFMGRKRPR